MAERPDHANESASRDARGGCLLCFGNLQVPAYPRGLDRPAKWVDCDCAVDCSE